MASRGTTFAKQDRDRAKKAKAAIKRERRETRDEGEETPEEPAVVVDEASNEEIMRQVEELHKRFDDKLIEFEDFEDRKAELMARITV
ncbi:MAG: hypothetical protein ACR2LQ_09235 [Acidimicrobiales bacterium]